MSSLEPIRYVNKLCPDCEVELIKIEDGKYKCEICGYIDKSEADKLLNSLFGFGG